MCFLIPGGSKYLVHKNEQDFDMSEIHERLILYLSTQIILQENINSHFHPLYWTQIEQFVSYRERCETLTIYSYNHRDDVSCTASGKEKGNEGIFSVVLYFMFRNIL